MTRKRCLQQKNCLLRKTKKKHKKTMDCSLFNEDENLCLIASPSSSNLGCGWCNSKCVDLKCEWGSWSSYYNSKCDNHKLITSSSNGHHVCSGYLTMTFAFGVIEIILILLLIIIILSFNCKFMTNFINKACNPRYNFRRKFSLILTIFHYIVSLIFGCVTLLFSFLSLKSESDSSIITWPYFILLIIWCDIQSLLDIIPYWILPYNNLNQFIYNIHLQNKRNRIVLFKIILFILYLIICFTTIYCAMFADDLFNKYQSTLLMTSIIFILFLYVILPLPITYSFWITSMLNQSANIKNLLKIQRKYLKKLHKKKRREKRKENEKSIILSERTELTEDTNSRLVTPRFKPNEEYTFTPSTQNKYLLNNRQFRSNSDPSQQSNNRKWSFSNQKQNDLLLSGFQLSAADMNQKYHYNQEEKSVEPQRVIRAKTVQPKKSSENNKNKNQKSPHKIIKKKNKVGNVRVSQIYRQRNGNYPANIRIDPYRRGFYFILWSLALIINVISYIDDKHSIFWDGLLIMFIYIIFKKFDHLLIVIINPFYRKCCSKHKHKKVDIEERMQQTQYRRLRGDKNIKHYDDTHIASVDIASIDQNNDIELNTSKRKKYNKDVVNKSNLKEPLMAKDGGSNTTAILMEVKDEEKHKPQQHEQEDETGSEDSDESESSDSANVYGPGSFAEGRIDEGYIGDRIFGVQMDFVNFAPTNTVNTNDANTNMINTLGTIWQSQPL